MSLSSKKEQIERERERGRERRYGTFQRCFLVLVTRVWEFKLFLSLKEENCMSVLLNFDANGLHKSPNSYIYLHIDTHTNK
jgi:hypothetical protein